MSDNTKYFPFNIAHSSTIPFGKNPDTAGLTDKLMLWLSEAPAMSSLEEGKTGSALTSAEFEQLDRWNPDQNTAELRFPEFQIRLRMLSILEQLFAQAGQRDQQLNYIESMLRLIDQWLADADLSGIARTTELVRMCAHGGVNDEYMEKHIFESEGAETTKNELNEYLIRFIPVIILTKTRLSDVLFNGNSDDIQLRHLDLAKEMAELVQRDGMLVNECVHNNRGSDEYADSLKFYILSTYGNLLIKYSNKNVLTSDFTAARVENESRQTNICKARKLLFDSLSIAGERENTKDTDIAVQDVNAVEDILRKIESNPQIHCT